MSVSKMLKVTLAIVLVLQPILAIAEETISSESVELTQTNQPRGGAEDHIQESKIPPLAVSPDRLLVTVGDTLYMLDANKKIAWKWSGANAPILDQHVVDSKGRIYGIAADGQMFSLDSSGKERWIDMTMGKAGYTQLKRYGDDQFLVVVSMWGYREDRKKPEDRLYAFRFLGGEGRRDIVLLWETAFPPDAELHVWRRKVLAIYYKKGSIEIREVSLPAIDL